MALASDPRLSAFRRRLADGQRARWLWALGSGLPGIGLVVLVAHGRSRRSLTPALFGLTALAAGGFALGSYAGISVAPARRGVEAGRAPGRAAAALVVAAGTLLFAFGHKHGQDRAAEEARKWLNLDR